MFVQSYKNKPLATKLTKSGDFERFVIIISRMKVILVYVKTQFFDFVIYYLTIGLVSYIDAYPRKLSSNNNELKITLFSVH